MTTIEEIISKASKMDEDYRARIKMQRDSINRLLGNISVGDIQKIIKEAGVKDKMVAEGAANAVLSYLKNGSGNGVSGGGF